MSSKSKKAISSKRRSPLSPLVAGTFLLIIVAAVYGEVCSFHFLPFWDDDTNIHRNPLYSPLSWESISVFWKGPFQQLYIPVTYSAWGGLVALSRILAGTGISVGPINPVLFHGANLLVHLLAATMVFLILRRLLAGQFLEEASDARVTGAAAVGALVFALHPIQVEAVAWVSGLRDLLGGAFSLVAIASFLAFLDEEHRVVRRWLSYATATLFLLLAFGSKPGSVVTPAIALLAGWLLLHARQHSCRRLLWLIPWFLLAGLEVLLTSRSQPAAELAASLVPLWARPLVATDATAFYMGKLVWPVWPWGLCADYGRSPNSILDSRALFLTWLVPASLLAVLIRFRKLRPYLLPFGIFVIGVLPTLGLIPFNFQIVSTVSDRYLYLAMLGPALAVGMLFCTIAFRTSLILSGILLCFWTTLTLLQLPQWADGNVFFQAVLARNPTSWKSCHNYACTLDTQGDLNGALREFQEAVRLRPSNAEAYNDMALTLMKLGRRQDAVNSFQQSLRIRPTAGAARNLASLLLMSGDPLDAVRVYRMAMQIDPGDLQNQRALAWVLATHPDARVRNGKEAAGLAEQIVQATNGQVPQFLLTWSAALAETGDFDQAVTLASRAAESYRRSGDARTAEFVEQTIIPALQRHQELRDDPVKSSGN